MAGDVLEDTKANKELLANWVKFGLAHPNPYGDGAWGWTALAKKTINPYVLSLLSDLLYGTPIPKYSHKTVLNDGFGFDPITGYVLEDD